MKYLPLEGLSHIFASGGALMPALAALGFFAYYLVFSVWFSLSGGEVSPAALARCSRDIKLVKILAAAAPMLGLLGTVAGIGMCVSAAGDSAAAAEGISRALLTTQTGLIISIPAWLAAAALSAKLNACAPAAPGLQ